MPGGSRGPVGFFWCARQADIPQRSCPPISGKTAPAGGHPSAEMSAYIRQNRPGRRTSLSGVVRLYQANPPRQADILQRSCPPVSGKSALAGGHSSEELSACIRQIRLGRRTFLRGVVRLYQANPPRQADILQRSCPPVSGKTASAGGHPSVELSAYIRQNRPGRRISLSGVVLLYQAKPPRQADILQRSCPPVSSKSASAGGHPSVELSAYIRQNCPGRRISQRKSTSLTLL